MSVSALPHFESGPLVSIVMPAYNTCEYIGRALDCAISQTYSKIEIIIADDGSTDGTAAIAESYATEDPRVRIIRLPHRGVSAARNAAICASHGDKLLFFDSDDIFELTLVEECVAALRRLHVNAVLFGYADLIGDVKKKPHAHCFEKNSFFGDEVAQLLIPRFIGHSFADIDDWVKGRKSMRQGKELSACWHLMFDAATVKRYGMSFDTNLSLGEDTIFINEYFLREESIGFIDKCLYYLFCRYEGANRTSNANPALMLDNKIKLMRARERLGILAGELHGIDLWILWRGTPLLSLLQLTIALSHDVARGSDANWGLLHDFASDPAVKRALNEYRPTGGKRSLPFRIAKAGMLRFMFELCKFVPKRVLESLSS